MIGGIFGKKKNKWGETGIPAPMGSGAGLPGPEAMQQPQQAKRPGFFQRDSTREGLSQFADTLIKLRSGVNPGLMDSLRQNQQREFAEAQYERKRTDDFADKVKFAQFERDNPKPVNNDTINDYQFILENFGKEKADQFIENNLVNPSFYTAPDGRRYANPSATGGGYGGELDSQPTVEDGMTYTPGPGGRANPENWKAGGGAGNGVGSFPGQ